MDILLKFSARVLTDQSRSIINRQTVADVCEATLGAAFKSGGHEFALKCLKTMSLPMKEYDRWSDLARHVRVPLPDPKICLPAKAVQELQKIIGFELAQPHLLAWAMVRCTIGCVAKNVDSFLWTGRLMVRS